jgi:peptidoglycan/LPS O-acetylase OafA/YrhL
VNKGLSVYLDGLRAFAAFVVVLSHFAYPRFSNGDYIWIRDYNLGSDAVMLFFVLSGFVIAFTADQKDRTAGSFLFNRLTRIYSVALPALVLTFAIDALGSHLYFKAYDGWWYGSSAPVARFLAAATFTNELGFQHIRVGTNGPYWSLTYEVWYYAMFAAVTFLDGARRWIVGALVALIAGPKILVLGVSWGAGVAAYHLSARVTAMSWERALALMWLPVAVYVACLWSGVPKMLLHWEYAVLGEDFVRRSLAFSDEFIWNGFIGLLFAGHILGAVRVMAERPMANARINTAVRWLAGGSFSLYIVHYPLLQFIGAALPWARATQAGQLLILLLVIAACYAFAAVFERTLNRQRAWLVETARRLAILRPQAV